jgi:hypothetical protein
MFLRYFLEFWSKNYCFNKIKHRLTKWVDAGVMCFDYILEVSV